MANLMYMNLTGGQETQFRTKWDTKWHFTFQQEVSKLTPFVTVRSDVSGEKIKSSWVGPLSIHEYTGTRQKNEVSDLKFGNRLGVKRKFSEMVPISRDEQMDMDRADYNLGLIQTQMKKGLGPFTDMVVLGLEHTTSAAPVGTILPGYNNAATITGYQLPASGRKGGILGTNTKEDANGDEQDAKLDYSRSIVDGVDTIGRNLIPVDYSTSGVGVSQNFAGTFLDKMGLLVRKYQEMDVLPTDHTGANDLVVAITPAIQQLLHAYEVGLNRDYGCSVLGDGSFNKFLQATVMVSTMLPTITTKKVKVGAETLQLEDVSAVACCAWLKSHVELLQWKNTEFDILDVKHLYKDVDYAVKVRGQVGCQRLNDDTVFVLPMEVA